MLLLLVLAAGGASGAAGAGVAGGHTARVLSLASSMACSDSTAAASRAAPVRPSAEAAVGLPRPAALAAAAKALCSWLLLVRGAAFEVMPAFGWLSQMAVVPAAGLVRHEGAAGETLLQLLLLTRPQSMGLPGLAMALLVLEGSTVATLAGEVGVVAPLGWTGLPSGPMPHQRSDRASTALLGVPGTLRELVVGGR
jgi:hypothetical protein